MRIAITIAAVCVLFVNAVKIWANDLAHLMEMR